MSLLIDLKDPRVSQVTVNSVEVASDMRTAKVLFTVLGGDPVKEKLALAGFRSAAGFLQQKCAKRIETRYTPKLTFAIDEGVKNLIRISEILEKERQQSASAEDTVDKVAESSDPKGTDIQQGD